MLKAYKKINTADRYALADFFIEPLPQIFIILLLYRTYGIFWRRGKV
jgi:hypothetical protein